jgi:hypothetical protein
MDYSVSYLLDVVRDGTILKGLQVQPIVLMWYSKRHNLSYLEHQVHVSFKILISNETNEFVLSLPYNATDYESALLPRSVYVQYDALRLEIK